MSLPTNTVLRTACALALTASASAILCAADLVQMPLTNAGFENGIRSVGPVGAKVAGDLGSGWYDNSDWADVRVSYAQEAEGHGGKHAQRITVTKVATGAVQMIQRVPFTKDHTYAFSVWMKGMKGTPGTTVCLHLRQVAAPFTFYATTEVTITDRWTEFRVEGQVGESVDGLVMIALKAPGDAIVDDLVLVDTTGQ